MKEIRPSEIRAEARNVLRGKWGKAALISLCYLACVVIVVVLQYVHPLLYLVGLLGVAMPIGVGMQYIFLDMKRGKQTGVKDLLAPVRNYRPILGLSLLTSILIGVGMILLIVPGFILALGFTMSFYILRDRPELGVFGSMSASWNMMRGHKMELFLVCLSFFGWIVLGILTLMIGFLWLYPYIYTAMACFYERIKEEERADNEI